jgi:alpha-2-macroglobulin
MSKILILTILLLQMAMAIADDTNQPKSLEITRITPSGQDVYPTRQIVFTFNQPVVALGKMEREADEIPIIITPELACAWRWMNTSNLVCELPENNKLKYATNYRILVSQEISAENGQSLNKAHAHNFSTQRPALDYAEIHTWRAPGMPLIKSVFNQPVSKKSVEKYLYIHGEDGRNIPIRAQLPENAEGDYGQNWIIFPQRLLPHDKEYQLIAQAGLESNLGPELSIKTTKSLKFRTFPKFTFLGIECESLDSDTISLNVGQNWQQRCNPLGNIGLRFSSPVLASMVTKNLLFLPELNSTQKVAFSEYLDDYSRLEESYYAGKEYYIWLPGALTAWQEYNIKSLGTINFRDEFGRPLNTAIDISFATDNRAPQHYMQYTHSVLESGVDSELPFYITNLDAVNINYRILEQQNWSDLITHNLQLPKIKNISVKIPFNVRQLIGANSGVVSGSYVTSPDTEQVENNWFFSQVTPYQVQAKLGHFNSLVWVSNFANGQAVANADVRILQGNYNSDKFKIVATNITNDMGIAILPGNVSLDPKLDMVYQHELEQERLFVQVERDGNMAILPLEYDYQIQMYDLDEIDYEIYPYRRSEYGHIKAWGTTAQGVYKVGDTVQYKILLRNQNNLNFVPAPEGNYTLKVADPMGKIIHESNNLKLNDFSSIYGEFNLPKTAGVGWYDFQLTANFADYTWYPMRVLVSDFTPAPFRVSNEIHGQKFSSGASLTVETLAKLHGGGAYSNAETRVTAILKPQTFNSTNPIAKNFYFDVSGDFEEDTIFQTTQNLDANGALLTTFDLPEAAVLYGQIMIESAVKDERGKNITSSTTARYVGRDRFVGSYQRDWLASTDKLADVQLLVVNADGNPVTGTNIKVLIEREETKAVRVKGAGNAYLTQYETSWVQEEGCNQAKLISDLEPISCNFQPTQAGSYRLTASIKDSAGLEHQTEHYIWVTGAGRSMWAMNSENGLSILPEQNSYAIGEVAKYLIKNPYQQAKALVTVERLGVLDSWVLDVTDSIQVIEIPVKENYAPGFYVSVTLFSPRVDLPLDANQVDLGKPTYRLGYVKTEVAQPYKQLSVEIKSDKQIYRPREEVQLEFAVNNQSQEPVELAVIVLDEAVFDLIQGGKNYFDPHKNFYSLEQLDMANFSLLTRLIGRQKFEKKGASAGGDGGMGLTMRSINKYVTYWNPSLIPDAQGLAKANFTLPDNLTGWRVLVIAVTPNDKMGLSDAKFVVNQPIELRPIMPNQVLDGDKFYAGFSLMNRTEETKQLRLNFQISGQIMGKEQNIQQIITAQPYQRYPIWLPLQANGVGEIQLVANAVADEDSDSLLHTIPVKARYSLVTQLTNDSTIAAKINTSLQIPEQIYPEIGGISLKLAPSVINGIDNAFAYMRDYPYVCWEQKLSKGVMAANYQQLQDYITELSWPESEILPHTTLELARDFQAPNGGMSYFVPQDNRVSPYLSAYTALAFNWLKAQGFSYDSKLEQQLHEYLLNLLRKNNVPDYYSAGMTASVRAVALAALAKHGKISRNDLKRYQLHVDNMSLFAKAMFLQAIMDIPLTNLLAEEVLAKILSHANYTATRIAFVENLDSNYKQLLSSPLRTECAILSALVRYADTDRATDVADLPTRLVRQITQARQHSGRWQNTQENMFCSKALIDYAHKYETETVAMNVTASFNHENIGQVEFTSPTDPVANFKRNFAPTDIAAKANLSLEKEGSGRLYYDIMLQYAEIKSKFAAINAGIEIHREYHVQRGNRWVLLQPDMSIARGELIRVDLYLSLPATRHYVVVDDPVPGGLEPVNLDLATSSAVDAAGSGQYDPRSMIFSAENWHGYQQGFWNFYHRELRHHAAIFYADYLLAGNYHLSYTAQAVTDGTFMVLPARAEEMYEPSIYGNSNSMQLIVKTENQ